MSSVKRSKTTLENNKRKSPIRKWCYGYLGIRTWNEWMLVNNWYNTRILRLRFKLMLCSDWLKVRGAETSI